MSLIVLTMSSYEVWEVVLIFYLPDKDFMVLYFSANFIFNPYKTKFCRMKKLYAGTKKGHVLGSKVGIQIFCELFQKNFGGF